MAHNVPGCPKCKQHVALWMVTFADMSSLLMAFFVLLVVMMPHGISDEEVKSISESFTGNISILNGGNSFSQGSLPDMGTNVQALPSNTAGRSLGQSVEKAQSLFQHVNSKMVSVMPTKDGFAIDLMGSSYFKPGSSELTDDTKMVLGKVAQLISDLQKEGINNLIKVKGFADAGVIATGSIKYNSNLELTSKRANNVVQYFWNLGVSPTRIHQGKILAKFQSIAYGEFQPMEPNISPEQRATNRKVEIEFLRDPDAY
jgi:chemotaxis protein MotB